MDDYDAYYEILGMDKLQEILSDHVKPGFKIDSIVPFEDGMEIHCIKILPVQEIKLDFDLDFL